MKVTRSLVLIVVATILLGVVVSYSDLGLIPVYLRSHPWEIIGLALFYGVLFFLRFFRNYILFRTNGFVHCSLMEFLPTGLVAGTVGTYGPLKSGELLAIELYHSDLGIDRSQSLAIIVVGRVLDVVCVLFLVTTGFSLVPSFVRSLGIYLTVMVTILSVVISLLFSNKFGLGFLSALKPLTRGHFSSTYERVEDLAQSYYQSLEQISSPFSLSLLGVLTLIRWILEVIYAYLIFRFFGLDMTLLTCMPVVGLSYAIGVSSGTPGGLGTFQLTSLGALVVLGNPVGVAAVAIVVSTGLSVTVNILMFLLGLILSRINWRKRLRSFSLGH